MPIKKVNPQTTIPEGYALVPIKPTSQMKKAAYYAGGVGDDGRKDKSWEGSIALAEDVLRLAYEAGYKRGLNEAGPGVFG